jgi:predicted RNA-binding Zn ribbon-like protein
MAEVTMVRASGGQGDWNEGFLFVANHIALDFLNTKPILDDGPQELLTDGDALGRWLFASGIVTGSSEKAIVQRWNGSGKGDGLVRDLTAFRERLRAAVTRFEAGSLPSDAFIAELNELLAKYARTVALRKKGSHLTQEEAFDLQRADNLWGIIAAAAADLISNVDPARVHKCESCVLHFHDTSKKGSRRWCSMNICGNRVKVAAYQRRVRKGQG